MIALLKDQPKSVQQFLDQLGLCDQNDGLVQFLNALKAMEGQVMRTSRIQAIVQWLQVFYNLTYGKLTQKEAADTKLSDFVEKY